MGRCMVGRTKRRLYALPLGSIKICQCDCGHLTSGHRIIPEGLVGSSENTMKLPIRRSFTTRLVGCTMQRPTVLIGAVCGYLDLL